MTPDTEMDAFETYKHPGWVRVAVMIAVLFTGVLLVTLAVLFLRSP